MCYSRPFWSYKYKKSVVRYEVGLCRKKGDICWWNGPYEPGDCNDGMISEDSLITMLEPGELCKTDKGYHGSAPKFVRFPGRVYDNLRMRTMRARVRSRQKMVNKQLKNWAILSVPYCHDLYWHGTVFGTVITLLQLSFEHNPLFSVEYNKGKLFIYLALAKPALPGQFDLLVSSQSKEKS
jgi:hypothetical protein